MAPATCAMPRERPTPHRIGAGALPRPCSVSLPACPSPGERRAARPRVCAGLILKGCSDRTDHHSPSAQRDQPKPIGSSSSAGSPSRGHAGVLLATDLQARGDTVKRFQRAPGTVVDAACLSDARGLSGTSSLTSSVSKEISSSPEPGFNRASDRAGVQGCEMPRFGSVAIVSQVG